MNAVRHRFDMFQRSGAWAEIEEAILFTILCSIASGICLMATLL